MSERHLGESQESKIGTNRTLQPHSLRLRYW